jgi:hypothetical protein
MSITVRTILLGVTVAAGALTLTACGDTATPAAPATSTVASTTSTSPTTKAAPTTFTLTGTLDFIGGATHTPADPGDGDMWDPTPEEWDGDPCEGDGGYSDITDGTAVTVYGPDGDIVALGSITQPDPYVIGGEAEQPGVPSDLGCKFQITVPDVPAGLGFYQYEIAHRGQLRLTEEDAKAGNASATLGE